ncbi:MAG TPA: amidase [Vicinamibacterales bacterium]|nr:amidase [Vicinamibacterales bacterium]
MADAELVFKSGQELGALIKAKKVSPVDVVQAFLDRIDVLNPRVNAYITVTHEHALAQARAAEQEIMAGKYRGALHGLPYAPKDILATKGILTTNGSKVTATVVPTVESTITSRLNRAGAILIGKLNLLEFAMGSGVVSGFGPSRNPWHLEYSPSGSSSGSGAALAAYMTPLSIGTDTGGSIRGPANNCGIVGLKQTYGRVSRYGVTTLSWTLDHAGPMTKTVGDAALILQAIAGADPMDPTATADRVPDYSRSLTGNVKKLRIGVPTNYFFDGVNAQTVTAVRAAIAHLQQMGATVVDVEVPHAELAGSAGWVVAMAEAACFHEQRMKATPELFDPVVRERLDAARFYSATDYIKALRVRSLLMDSMQRVFEQCDVMAVPSGNPATRLESAEMAASDVKPGSTATPYRAGNTFIGNMTGLPAIVIPCGFTTDTPTLPLGLQFYGKPFDEATLFRISHAYESTTDWHRRRPALDISRSTDRSVSGVV